MKSSVLRSGLLVSVFIFLTPVQAADGIDPVRIEIFTDHVYPVSGIEIVRGDISAEIQVYELDAPDRLEAQLSENLPKDRIAAEYMAAQWFSTLDHEALTQQFKAAYAGILKALAYGIDRYPAVVFDQGASVVYGVTDLHQALAYYRDWRAGGDRP